MKDIKKYFPALQNSVYLNTPANGLLPQPVYEWRRKQDSDFLNNPDTFRNSHKQRNDETKEILAEHFDSQKEDIALVPNFSFGINMVLEGLEKGQKIMLLRDDYPSVNWPVETRDFEIVYVNIDENLEENILNTAKKHHPDIFLFSIVQWLSGIKIDLNFLHQLKSQFPDLLIMGDGTQYLGTEEFSFNKSALDVLASSAYKWLTAGFGNGFLMIKEEVRNKIKTYSAGFNSAPSFSSGLADLPYMSHFEPGHQDSLSYGTIGEAIKFLNEIGEEECYEHIKKMSKRAKKELEKLNLLDKSVVGREIHSSIFNLRGEEGIAEKLKANNISFSPRGGGIRIGFHYYNDESDLNKLIEALKG